MVLLGDLIAMTQLHFMESSISLTGKRFSSLWFSFVTTRNKAVEACFDQHKIYPHAHRRVFFSRPSYWAELWGSNVLPYPPLHIAWSASLFHSLVIFCADNERWWQRVEVHISTSLQEQATDPGDVIMQDTKQHSTTLEHFLKHFGVVEDVGRLHDHMLGVLLTTRYPIVWPRCFAYIADSWLVQALMVIQEYYNPGYLSPGIYCPPPTRNCTDTRFYIPSAKHCFSESQTSIASRRPM